MNSNIHPNIDSEYIKPDVVKIGGIRNNNIKGFRNTHNLLIKRPMEYPYSNAYSKPYPSFRNNYYKQYRPNAEQVFGSILYKAEDDVCDNIGDYIRWCDTSCQDIKCYDRCVDMLNKYCRKQDKDDEETEKEEKEKKEEKEEKEVKQQKEKTEQNKLEKYNLLLKVVGILLLVIISILLTIKIAK